MLIKTTIHLHDQLRFESVAFSFFENRNYTSVSEKMFPSPPQYSNKYNNLK